MGDYKYDTHTHKYILYVNCIYTLYTWTFWGLPPEPFIMFCLLLRMFRWSLALLVEVLWSQGVLRPLGRSHWDLTWCFFPCWVVMKTLKRWHSTWKIMGSPKISAGHLIFAASFTCDLCEFWGRLLSLQHLRGKPPDNQSSISASGFAFAHLDRLFNEIKLFLNIYLFSDQLYDHLMIIVEQLSGIQWLMAWIPGFFQSGPWNCPALLWPGDLRDLLAAAVQLCCSAFCLWRRFAMRSRWVGVPSWDKELLPKPHLCIVTDSWLSWGFRSFQFGTSRKDMCFRGGYISDDWWLPRISKA